MKNRTTGAGSALAFAAVLLAPASEASLPHSVAPAHEASEARVHAWPASGFSDFSLFEGDEIFRTLAKRRIADDRYTYTWHYDGKLATAVVKDCWPIEHGESQGPDCPAGYTRPTEAGHELVFSYDALSRLLTRTHLGILPTGETDDSKRPFIETREYLFDGNTLLAEVARAQDGAIRWRKTYVPGADLHDHVQVRVETYDAAQSVVSDRLYAYIRDEQGTVLALADESSDPAHPSLAIRYLYSPYGNAHAETGPELRKGSYVFGLTSVEDAGGATKTQTTTGTLPGGIRLSFGIDVDPGTFGAGVVIERRATDGTWGALTAAEMAIGRASDAAASDVDILPLSGFAFATSYRVRTTSALKDVFGRALADPKVLELPQTPPVVAPGDIGASSFEYDRRFPVDYDSAEAAADDANGIFPGGQPMGFQGQYTDPVLGFLLTPNRAYDARNGAWLSQDPLGDRDSPNLYGFVSGRPHELTDPLGLATPITDSYTAAANEALNPNNSAGMRVTFGVLALLTAPVSGLEQVADTIIDTPGRMWRSSKGVVSETQATFAAKDADARLRHGSAAFGHASQLFLDATVVEGVVESTLVRAAEKKAAQAVAVRASETTAPASAPPMRPAWQASEKTAGAELEGFGFQEQKSYLAGKEVPYGTRGSVRPDLVSENLKLTVDVKNYNVATPQGRYNLVQDVIEQVPTRAANLPAGTRQGLILDIRGQTVSEKLLDAMIKRIVTKSNGAIPAENVVVLR